MSPLRAEIGGVPYDIGAEDYQRIGKPPIHITNSDKLGKTFVWQDGDTTSLQFDLAEPGDTIRTWLPQDSGEDNPLFPGIGQLEETPLTLTRT
jgi:hypothetical protein